MIQGIDNIGICATDVARAVAFYQRLGFLEAYRSDRGVLMAVGDAHLFIFATRQSLSAGRRAGAWLVRQRTWYRPHQLCIRSYRAAAGVRRSA